MFKLYSPLLWLSSLLQFCVVKQAIDLTLGSQLGLKFRECTVGALGQETLQGLSLSLALQFRMTLAKLVKLPEAAASQTVGAAMAV